MRFWFVLPAVLALLVGTLDSTHAQGIAQIAATPDSLIVTPAAGSAGSARLVELRTWQDYDPIKGWSNDGFGATAAFAEDVMQVTFFDPAPDPFDPFFNNARQIRADLVDQFAMRVRMSGTVSGDDVPFMLYVFGGGPFQTVPFTVTPDGVWRTVRLDLATELGGGWADMRTIRLDPAESQDANAANYTGATLEIDWIAVTDDAAFDGTGNNAYDVLWDFGYPAPVWTGTLNGPISIARFEGARDRLYSKFQLADASNAALGSPHYVTDITAIQPGPPDYSNGWMPQSPSTTLEFVEDFMRVGVQEPPGGTPYDPIVQNFTYVDAAGGRYLVFKYTLTGVAGPGAVPLGLYMFPDVGGISTGGYSLPQTGEPTTIAFDLNSLSAGWSGRNRIRFDIDDGVGSPANLLNATLEIDWIALTDDPAFDGSDPSVAGEFWDFQAGSRFFEFPNPESIKGVGIQLVDDAVELGVREAGVNVVLNALLDDPGPNLHRIPWMVDGEEVLLNSIYVGGLDSQFKQLTDLGMNLSLIIIFQVPDTPDLDDPLIHPLTDLAGTPNNLGAMNAVDERGYRAFRACMEFLAWRYGDPNNSVGWVSNYIIGNELQSHWYWHNLGLADEQTVITDYARLCRIADMAVRRMTPDARVFFSLEHHWNSRFGGDPLKAMSGKALLEGLADMINAEGDFPWELAHHPYPENLFDPEFWFDTTATFDLNTQRVTFDNVELLPAILSQSRYRYEGEIRNIILSEQGFHTPDQPDGQDIQAAAYAYSWRKISQVPEIDAYILHRQVDFRGEGGLDLGLWTNDDAAPFPAEPLAKKKSWFVFQAADRPNWQSVFDPYLPFLPFSDWDDADPLRTIINFRFTKDLERWEVGQDIVNLAVNPANGTLTADVSGADPLMIREKMYVLPGLVEQIVISMRTTGAGPAQLFWATEAEPVFTEPKSAQIPTIADGYYHEYLLDLRGHALWPGQTIVGLRLDPNASAAGSAFAIDYIVGGPADAFRIPRASAGDWVYYD